jgi:two-component system cell cycle response regulator DivK
MDTLKTAGAAHILYVEDNADNRILVQRVLEAAGYRVTLANDPHTGLALAEAERPDLVLMDINLPGMDGYAMTARLKAKPEYRSLRIVALTANVMKGDYERTLVAGCDGYIQKPIDVDALPGQIAHFLDLRFLSSTP